MLVFLLLLTFKSACAKIHLRACAPCGSPLNLHCIMSLEVNDWDHPLVKRYKLSEHTDSSSPRNADPQGERGDREQGENEAYFSANFKSVCSSVLSEGSPERHVLTDNETGIIHSFMNLPRKYKT